MKKFVALALSAFMSASALFCNAQVLAQENILSQGAWFESAYIEWEGISGTQYSAYYKESGADESAYIKVDDELVRCVEGSSYRVDVLGLKGGQSYDIKLVDSTGAVITVYTATPQAFDRSGFAFDSETDAPGAYNMDGTVPDNALVIYVTEENKSNVYNKKNITSALSGLNSLNDGKPVIIRFIGKVTPYGSSTSPGMWKNTCGVTIEGVGPESGLYGWGIGSGDNKDTEFRNLNFCDYVEDAIGFEGAQKLWVHNNNFYSGYNPKDSSSERDKLHGDGSCDLRECNKVTVSYNHFDGTDKTSLIGSSSSNRESTGNITFHHNFFDNTNQRTPRVRWHNIHVYNNYYKGTDAYGVGATCNGNIFAENNYFEDAASPFLTSSQGGFASKFSDNDGGVIKAFNNVMVNCRESLEGVDYFNAPSREYRLTAEDFTTVKGGYVYNNFDASGYIAQNNYILETPEAAKKNVKKNAGAISEAAIEIADKVSPPEVVGSATNVYYYDSEASGTVASGFGGPNGVGDFFKGSITCSAKSASGYRDTTKYSYSGSFTSSGSITFTTSSQAKLTIIASSTASAPVRVSVTNSENADAVYHGTFQTGSKGGDVLSTIELLEAGTYTFKPTTKVDIYYIEVAEYDGIPVAEEEEDDPPVIEEGYIYGDATANSMLEASDAAEILQKVLTSEYVLPLEEKTESYIKYLDVDGDGNVLASDAAMVVQKVLNGEYKFPVEQ